MPNNSTCKTMPRAVIVRICLETILNEASVRSIESNSLRRNIVLEIHHIASARMCLIHFMYCNIFRIFFLKLIAKLLFDE